MIINSAKKVLEIEARAIKNLLKSIDNNFVKTVNLILSCRGRVIITGVGKSGLIGKKISATLSSTGTPSFFLDSLEAFHGDLGMVLENDVILAISNSGESEEINKLLSFFKKNGNQIIAFTGNKKSTLAKKSDLVINIHVKKEACSLGLAPTASTTATLAMGDALAVALLDKRGFKKKDFIRLHPGGTLGKRLMLKIQDIMITGKNIPIVNEKVILIEAIKEITQKKQGFTCVVDKKGKLVGIITDGDLRRGIQKNVDFTRQQAQKMITLNPQTIGKNELVAKAIEIMEKKGITSLIIVDRQKKPIGIVHLHDLLGRSKFKVK
ncbi:MAG: KpsF/GutQ family sugar-phosphate isomerase [Candidatus Omnitrophica bacterium]|nr:KpsF/GutQ family sugar-phosphate isomerase [Candidatus Omnitrophota bacterium]MBU1047110.1 KpsF/GutQ family sugar-phosphate isomerase [Candidatus Omnitrophota bacterium]MBU1630638.1 KpsF/GutQ family sugar-phosphate isomerase [Candidatus Omnitrophota bacterium]MBU1767279.1 KpsF/GutQ family sugar-phosphate isomerase [Candidatus Omnitrophota bacterium]MBU1889008.1 KpsF/GutQ family sugar-phosphate isomerase [Candidatus Omnitrophota bacterium]